jgi:hypothetical protein
LVLQNAIDDSGRKWPSSLRHRVQALAVLHLVPALLDLAFGMLGLHRDLHGLLHELRAELGDALRVGGREQQGLALFGALARHGGDVVEEAHVEHAVGLVEHQGVERFERQVLALQVVHHAAGRAHHDVRAMLQAQHLAAQRHAAAQGHDLDVFLGPRQAADLGSHLVGQFARGAQHQRLHGKAAGVQVGQQGQAKAAVLPLPVLAWAIRSLPSSAGGRLAAWMGVIGCSPAAAGSPAWQGSGPAC